MTDSQQINIALSRFANWSKPWEYLADTLSFPGLTADQVAQIETIWSEASKADHWVGVSSRPGAELASETLRMKYPWLSEQSIANLIDGASYQWK